jgi:hypothetical protein
MTSVVEVGPWGSEAGTSDQVFIQRLRQLLRDRPTSANEQTSGNGTSTSFQLNQVGVYDSKYTQVTVGGNIVPIVESQGSITSSNVYIDFDTGLVIFGTAPPIGTNNVTITKTKVRWSDSVLLASLQGGLRALFPSLYKTAIYTGITMQVNQWLYSLPSDFWDPRVQFTKFAIQEVPSSVNQPRWMGGMYRVGLEQIQIPTSQAFTPGATLWLEYKSPYRSLSELEPQAYDLPLWYAAAQLLGFDEARRTNVDNQSVAAGASANPPQYQQNAGTWYMQQFNALKAALKSAPARMPRPMSTYEY